MLTHFHSLYATDTFSKGRMQDTVVELFSGFCSMIKDKDNKSLFGTVKPFRENVISLPKCEIISQFYKLEK